MVSVGFPAILCLLLPVLYMSTKVGSTMLLNEGNQSSIQEFCTKSATNFPDLCVSILEAHPESSKTDHKGLTKIFTKTAMENTTKTASYLAHLLTKPNSVVLNRTLTDCYEEYILAGHDFTRLNEKLDYNDFDSARGYASAVGAAYELCHDTFRMFPKLSYPPVLATSQEFLDKILDIVFSIINQILQ